MSWVNPRLNAIVATMVGRDPVMDEAAARVAAAARRIVNSDTGAYASSITTRRTPSGKDRLVTATDKGAAAIEFGHTAPDGVRVPGRHVMAKAAASA